jgi:hypothetical protein
MDVLLSTDLPELNRRLQQENVAPVIFQEPQPEGR